MKFKFLFVAALALMVGLQACNQAANTAKETTNKAADATKNAASNALDAVGNTANKAADAIDPDQPTTTVSWDKEEHDFGNINEGDKVSTAFTFTNTGNEPLIISSAKGSCGCTVPEWPKEPIAPGATGTIDVEFNSKNKPGRQTKTVTIQANTDPNPIRLKIKAEVAKDPNAPANNASSAQPIQVQPTTQGK